MFSDVPCKRPRLKVDAVPDQNLPKKSISDIMPKIRKGQETKCLRNVVNEDVDTTRQTVIATVGAADR